MKTIFQTNLFRRLLDYNINHKMLNKIKKKNRTKRYIFFRLRSKERFNKKKEKLETGGGEKANCQFPRGLREIFSVKYSSCNGHLTRKLRSATSCIRSRLGINSISFACLLGPSGESRRYERCLSFS